MERVAELSTFGPPLPLRLRRYHHQLLHHQCARLPRHLASAQLPLPTLKYRRLRHQSQHRLPSLVNTRGSAWRHRMAHTCPALQRALCHRLVPHAHRFGLARTTPPQLKEPFRGLGSTCARMTKGVLANSHPGPHNLLLCHDVDRTPQETDLPADATCHRCSHSTHRLYCLLRPRHQFAFDHVHDPHVTPTPHNRIAQPPRPRDRCPTRRLLPTTTPLTPRLRHRLTRLSPFPLLRLKKTADFILLIRMQ